jgi:acyl-CoA reductase-like NAD-dependent aldehyde dehydrogenase
MGRPGRRREDARRREPRHRAGRGKIALGSAADVDSACKAARKAFASWSQTSREERLEVLGRILAEYQNRFGDLATAVTEEMGAPASLAHGPRFRSASATWRPPSRS